MAQLRPKIVKLAKIIGGASGMLVKIDENAPEYYCMADIVTDEEAIQTAKDLARLEGLMCGISSGTNVAAARKLAKKLGEGKTVVTILPDTAERYFSTPLFENE